MAGSGPLGSAAVLLFGIELAGGVEDLQPAKTSTVARAANVNVRRQRREEEKLGLWRAIIVRSSCFRTNFPWRLAAKCGLCKVRLIAGGAVVGVEAPDKNTPYWV